MSIVSNNLKRIKPSPTLAVSQKARELKAAGKDVISLGAGEPDFDTPDNIKQAAIRAINEGDTKYTAVDGTPVLKDAIIKKFKRENNLEYQVDQITVGAGGKHVIYNAMVATLNEGDEVVIPAPYWVSYPDIVLLAGGTPVILECDEKQGFKIDVSELEKSITKKTKWIILNSPSNPTGACYSEDDIREIAKVLTKYPHVYILSDDIYEHLMFDGHKFASILNVAPDLRDRTLLVNGVSKAFAMTGWRIGYGAGPVDLIKAMNVVQGQSCTHACSISQAASIAALNGPSDFMADRANSFSRRRDIVVSALNAIVGISCLNPEGAFYVYPNCAGLIGRKTPEGRILTDDQTVCNWLLDVYHVSVVPGVAFGLSPHIRISTAASEDTLREACRRISTACLSLESST